MPSQEDPAEGMLPGETKPAHRSTAPLHIHFTPASTTKFIPPSQPKCIPLSLQYHKAKHNTFTPPLTSSQLRAKTIAAGREQEEEGEPRSQEEDRRARAATAMAWNHRRPPGPRRQQQEPGGSRAPGSSMTTQPASPSPPLPTIFPKTPQNRQR